MGEGKEADVKLEIPEGKNLDKTLARAISYARSKRHEVMITRSVTVHGSVRQKPILFVSPKGDVSEVVVQPLRISIGERVVEQVLGEGHLEGPAARLLQAHNRIMGEKSQRRKAA